MGIPDIRSISFLTSSDGHVLQWPFPPRCTRYYNPTFYLCSATYPSYTGRPSMLTPPGRPPALGGAVITVQRKYVALGGPSGRNA
ncbi:hypothetical protein AVEN_267690-1 [Araneus ventricosus]|uniref:Uncharacterized protein n=1 Tax=Araneus ventricosus TaxID=182803 RepID=A0A4Y2N3Y3_ARAVE|nr:hypothetical protein AVEN_267690-1 [Araneus ventricosus]